MLRIMTAALLFAFGSSATAQTRPADPPATAAEASTYLLGPDDQLMITVAGAADISNRVARISTTGYISLPMAGSIHASGLTVEQLEAEIVDRLKTYFTEPEVSVTRTEMRSQPVSVIGAVNNPGVQDLKGRKTLIEILSMAGGLKEDAGTRVRITRRLQWGRIPLPDAADDPTGQYSIAEVELHGLTAGANPAENILIMPQDTISVPKGEMVYVIGEVGKAGGIVLGSQQQMTVLQAVSMAAGLNKAAKPKEAKILRLNALSARRDEVPVDLKALLAGKIDDVPMQANDILLVPSGVGGNMTVRAFESALQIGTGIAILSARP